jgi:two-component system, OmpR family, aerobic respiration control sensor histidine kinase ArcB
MEDASFMRAILNGFCEISPNFLVIADKKHVLYANPKTKNLLREFRCIRHILPNYLYSTQKSLIKKITLPNRQRLIIRWHCYPFISKRNHPLILFIGEDITENETLRQRMEMLNYIITKVPGFVFWKDTELKLMGCNDNFAKQIGFQYPEDVVGLTDYDLPWNPEQTKKFIRDDSEILKTGLEKINIEEKQRQLDGKDLFLLTSKVPLYDRDKIVGVLGIYIDITPFKEAEQALRAEKDKAEAANRLKSDFILNMQHDIRTPISGIYGMTELLINMKIPTDIKSQLTEVAQAAKELLDYCNDILDFSHVEYGSRPVVHQPFSLKQVINSVLQMQKPAARLKKIRLSMHYGKKMPDVMLGDAYRIKRILINLISNAVKFTSQGYVKINIKSETHNLTKREQVIRFSIADSGIGIPAEKIDFIYEKFSKITPSNKGLYKGNGLGLRIVKQFIEEMGGNISVNSELNQGTVFQVFLPLTIPLSNHIFEG